MYNQNLFSSFYPTIKAASYFFYVLPRFLVEWFWILSDLLPGYVGVGFRYMLALRLARSIGKNVFFGRNVEVKCWENITIGCNVSIHKGCYIDATGNLTIESNVSIAHNTSIITFEHEWHDRQKPIKYNTLKIMPVIIKNDVWIGCGCRILSGVTIENRSIVAAGAVVTSNVLTNTLVGGIPARVIKKI